MIYCLIVKYMGSLIMSYVSLIYYNLIQKKFGLYVKKTTCNSTAFHLLVDISCMHIKYASKNSPAIQ